MSFTLIFQLVLCLSIGGSPVSVVETRTHNAANELQGIATHDANGNMTLMPGLKGKYDAWNRLVEVRNADDVVIATYEYNGLNQRIKKTVGGVLTKSFYNENWQEVESVTGSQMTSYVWGMRYIDDLVLREKGEERLYSLADPNWNAAALVGAAGTIAERMKYDAFGKITWLDAGFTAKAASGYGWNRAFTGQVLDSETGLMLYRNRYFNVLLGRWTSKDPIEYEAGDENLYRYVGNQVIIAIDPLGLQISWSEMFAHIKGVGPISAITGRTLSRRAHIATEKNYPNVRPWNNDADAFRHCYWSCLMAIEMGYEQSKIVGDIHEKYGNPSDKRETSMDLYNNSIGRNLAKCAKKASDCEQACLKEAGKGGLLQTSLNQTSTAIKDNPSSYGGGYTNLNGKGGYSGYNGATGYSGLDSSNGYTGLGGKKGYTGYNSESGYTGYNRGYN